MRMSRASWMIALCTLASLVSLGACGDDDGDPPVGPGQDASLDTTPTKDGATSDAATSDAGEAGTPDTSTPDTSTPLDGAADVVSDSSTDAAADADAADASICEPVDWSAVTAGTSATGTLGSVNVTFTGVSLTGGTTNGSSTLFSSNTLYTPALATTDHIELNGTPTASYTLTFSAPVTNPRFYLKSFASTMTFGGSPTITKISGDAALTAAANVATGVINDTTSSGYDTNGIIEYAGTVSSITFTLAYATIDGIYMQVYACH